MLQGAAHRHAALKGILLPLKPTVPPIRVTILSHKRWGCKHFLGVPVNETVFLAGQTATYTHSVQLRDVYLDFA